MGSVGVVVLVVFEFVLPNSSYILPFDISNLTVWCTLDLISLSIKEILAMFRKRILQGLKSKKSTNKRRFAQLLHCTELYFYILKQMFGKSKDFSRLGKCVISNSLCVVRYSNPTGFT